MARTVLTLLSRETIRCMDGKTAFSSWNGRIAPVFDVARQVLLVETGLGRIVCQSQETLPGDDPGAKASRLSDLGVTTLVCGAVSRFLQRLVASHGITVVPFVAGDLREVVDAWIKGGLGDDFAMPGCCRRHREAPGCGGLAPGGSASPEDCGMCVCPRCGHREPHKKGIPCLNTQCPICFSMMIRGT